MDVLKTTTVVRLIRFTRLLHSNILTFTRLLGNHFIAAGGNGSNCFFVWKLRVLMVPLAVPNQQFRRRDMLHSVSDPLTHL